VGFCVSGDYHMFPDLIYEEKGGYAKRKRVLGV
jgi:hypothetical protein